MDRNSPDKRYIIPLVIFFIGLVLTIIGLQFETVKSLFFNIETVGYLGAFLAGILYSTSLTSSSATVIFAQMPHHLNPLLIAIIAGFGSIFYDTTLFALFRSQQKRRIIETIKNRFFHNTPLVRGLTLIGGLIILASPLPDELAAGILSLSQMKIKDYIMVSFLLNAVGILMIVLIGR